MSRALWEAHIAERKAVTRIGKSNAAAPDVRKSRSAQLGAPVAAAPLIGMCRAAGLPVPVTEYTFAKPRKWRADYCWPAHNLMLEVEGGLWTQGRHSRGVGAIADLAKYSEAAIIGYRILYATPDQVRDGTALDRVARALGGLVAA